MCGINKHKIYPEVRNTHQRLLATDKLLDSCITPTYGADGYGNGMKRCSNISYHSASAHLGSPGPPPHTPPHPAVVIR